MFTMRAKFSFILEAFINSYVYNFQGITYENMHQNDHIDKLFNKYSHVVSTIEPFFKIS